MPRSPLPSVWASEAADVRLICDYQESGSALSLFKSLMCAIRGCSNVLASRPERCMTVTSPLGGGEGRKYPIMWYGVFVNKRRGSNGTSRPIQHRGGLRMPELLRANRRLPAGTRHVINLINILGLN